MKPDASSVTVPRHLKTARAFARRLAAAIGPGARVGVERYGPGRTGLRDRRGASGSIAFAEGPADDTGTLRITVVMGAGPAHTDLLAAVRRAGLGKEPAA